MYDELVKRLRAAKAVVFKTEDVTLLCDAADAIEELLRRCEQFQYMPPPAWIPVTERLPDMHMVHSEYGCGDYMISDAVAIYAIDLGETPEVFCGMYEKDLGEDGFEGWTDCEGNPFNTVTHWMPLPEPPKEETIS